MINSKNTYFLEMTNVIHTLVRGEILKNNFKLAFQSISLQLFPLFESSHERKVIKFSKKELEMIANHIKHMDDADLNTGSCISNALTTQAILFASGIDSYFVIGVNNKDIKLRAHAWVEVPEIGIIDYQSRFENFKVMKKLSMYKEIERWFTLNNENMDSVSGEFDSSLLG